jgi:hypothetical protein
MSRNSRGILIEEGTMEKKGYQLVVISAWDAEGMFTAADRGSKLVQECCFAIGRFLAMLEKVKPGEGPTCLMCDQTFHGGSELPEAFGIMTPMFPGENDNAILAPICTVCAAGRKGNSLLEPAALRLRDLLPDLELLTQQ